MRQERRYETKSWLPPANEAWCPDRRRPARKIDITWTTSDALRCSTTQQNLESSSQACEEAKWGYHLAIPSVPQGTILSHLTTVGQKSFSSRTIQHFSFHSLFVLYLCKYGTGSSPNVPCKIPSRGKRNEGVKKEQ